ncbi:MAG: hypothetical protein JWP11_3681 [Frankiales bacterium]|nr:hypothetical protein [Frankiales bacterium]
MTPAPHIEWSRSTLGWRPEGTVLYVEHRLQDRPLQNFIARLDDWLDGQGWVVAITRHSGSRVDQSSAGTKFTFGALELVGRNLMQVVDPVLLRDTIDELAADAVLLVQQQVDQEEKHREDFLAALRAPR